MFEFRSFYITVLITTGTVTFATQVSSSSVARLLNIELLSYFQSSFPEDAWDIPEHFQKDFPYYMSGYDYEGRPVMIVESGRWNFRKVIDTNNASEIENLTRHIEKGIAILKAMLEKTANENAFNSAEVPSDGGALIIDVAGFDYFQMTSPKTINYMLQLSRNVSGIADMISYACIINVNFAAEQIHNLARPMLGSLFDKFELFGTNKATWIPVLLKKIPASQLPEWYGGSKDFQPIAVFG